MAIDVIIVEDDNRLRSGLVEIVNSDPQCTCVGAFGSGEEALAQAPALHPQVAVMDINLPAWTASIVYGSCRNVCLSCRS
jgi:two-component system response regulator DevR